MFAEPDDCSARRGTGLRDPNLSPCRSNFSTCLETPKFMPDPRGGAGGGFATVKDLLELLCRLLSLYELKVALHVLEEWADQPFASSGLFTDVGGLVSAISLHGGDDLCELVAVRAAGSARPRRWASGKDVQKEGPEAAALCRGARAAPSSQPPPAPCQPLPPDDPVEEDPGAAASAEEPPLHGVFRELEAMRTFLERSEFTLGKIWESQQQVVAAQSMPRTWSSNAALVMPDTEFLSELTLRTQSSDAKKAYKRTRTKDYRKGRERTVRRQEQSRLQRIVRHPAFEYVCAVVILTHSILLGVYVQYEATVDGEVHPVLKWAQLLLTFIFLVEVVIKMAAEKVQYFLGKDWKSNMFDCIILSMVFIEGGIFLITNSSPGLKSFAQVGEMIRTARVLRILKFLRLSPTLQVILGKILASMSSLLWVTFLIFLLLYVAAVCIAHGAHEYLVLKRDESLAVSNISNSTIAAERVLHVASEADLFDSSVEREFGSVTRCIYTLFQSITGGDLWGRFADILFDMHWLYFTIFVLYIGLVTFGVLNTVTGIFVDASIMSRQQQREQMLLAEQAIWRSIEQSLREVFQEVDEDQSGSLTYEELEDMMSDERVQMFLKHLKIDATDTKKLFQVLDVDGSREIELEEFVSGIMRVKGEATSLDILQLRKKVERSNRLLGVVAGVLLRGGPRLGQATDISAAMAEHEPEPGPGPHGGATEREPSPPDG